MFIKKCRNIWLITKCLLPLHQKKKLITFKALDITDKSMSYEDNIRRRVD